MDRHLTVAVFVVYEDKTLLHWHKKHAMWLPVGGHVDPNESPCEAAVRETKEEAGLDVELFVPRGVIWDEAKDVRKLIAPVHMQNETIGPDHEHVDCIFYARARTFDLQPLPGETPQLDWCNAAELDRLPLAPDVRAYALEALRLL